MTADANSLESLGPSELIRIMNSQESDKIPSGGEIFKDERLALGWFVLLTVVVVFVSWPIRNFLLVCWVYGKDGYFRKGIRVLPGKPTRFSNGELAPDLPDFVTGFGAAFVTVGTLTALLVCVVRLLARSRARHTKKP